MGFRSVAPKGLGPRLVCEGASALPAPLTITLIIGEKEDALTNPQAIDHGFAAHALGTADLGSLLEGGKMAF